MREHEAMEKVRLEHPEICSPPIRTAARRAGQLIGEAQRLRKGTTMAVQKQDGLHTDTAESNVDLRGLEDRFCTRRSDGKLELTNAGGVDRGVISEGRDVGYHTSFNTLGSPILRVQAGAAIARGAEVQSNGTGQAVTGSTNPSAMPATRLAALARSSRSPPSSPPDRWLTDFERKGNSRCLVIST
jgi:hypothetical protein